jgi:muramoyltetrapeptide carboxypeptidase
MTKVNTIKVPQYIRPGDTIGFVSTASVIDPNVVEPAVGLLNEMGYRVLKSENLYSRNHQFAGTDLQRSSDIQYLIDHPEVKAIVCSRGGYGSLRAASLVNWDKFDLNPKWMVGFSDVTVIHSRLHNAGVASIHGVMPRYFLSNGDPSESFMHLADALIGKPMFYTVETSPYNRIGKAVGQVVGGNLSILYSLRGTPFDIDTNGKILFIEDLSEYLYHLDRMMTNLKIGGRLDNLAALVVGSFTGMKDNDTPFGKSAEEIILEAVSEFAYPVLFNFPAGHREMNFPLKLGVEAALEVSNPCSTFTQ